MIVKYEDHEGASFYDNVYMLTKLKGEEVVKMSQIVAGIDPPVAVREFKHGTVTCFGPTGQPLQVFNLGSAKQVSN